MLVVDKDLRDNVEALKSNGYHVVAKFERGNFAYPSFDSCKDKESIKILNFDGELMSDIDEHEARYIMCK